MKNRTNMNRAGLALTIAAVTGLAGCGNDSERLATSAMIRQAGSMVAGGVLPGKKKAPPPTAAQQAQGQAGLAAAALRSLKGPVIMVTLEKSKAVSVLGMIGDNNGVRTYATPAEQQMMLRGGLLAGTRGLGRDLMSSETDAAGALIRGQRAGRVTRTQRYLDGDWVERPVVLTCEIAPAGTVSAGGLTGMQMAETCTAGAAKVQNSYVVAGGQIIASRQWIGPYEGYVSIQTLRP